MSRKRDDTEIKAMAAFIRSMDRSKYNKLLDELELTTKSSGPVRQSKGMRVKGPSPEERNENISAEDYANYLRAQGLLWRDENDRRTSIQAVTVDKLEKFVRFCTQRRVNFSGNVSDNESKMLMARLQDMLNMSAQYANFQQARQQRLGRGIEDGFSREEIEEETGMDMGRFEGILGMLDEE